MDLRVGDKVKVICTFSVAEVWWGREGRVVGIFGDLSPFHFEVEIPVGEGRPKYLLFKGDELEKMGD